MSFFELISILCVNLFCAALAIAPVVAIIWFILRRRKQAPSMGGTYTAAVPSTNVQNQPSAMPSPDSVPTYATVDGTSSSSASDPSEEPARSGMPLEFAVKTGQSQPTEINSLDRLKIISTRSPAPFAPLSGILIALAQDLLVVSRGDYRALVQGAVTAKAARIKQYIEREARGHVAPEVISCQRDLHLIALSYLVSELDRLKSAAKKNKPQLIEQRIRTSSDALACSYQQHLVFHTTLAQYGIQFPIATTRNTEQAGSSTLPTKSALPSSIDQLLDAYLLAMPEDTQVLESQLVALGPAAFDRVYYRSGRAIGVGGAHVEEDQLEAWAERMGTLINRIDEHMPTCVLVEMFRKDVEMSNSRSVGSLRPKISRWSETMLRSREEEAIPSLIALLQDSHTDVAVRLLTINVLNDIRTPEGNRALLKVAQEDSDALCRYLAVTAFVDKATPADVTGLIDAMEHEIVQTSVDAFGAKVEMITSLTLSGTLGKGALVGEVLKQGMKFLNSEAPVDLSTAQFGQLKPTDRLQVFGYAYQKALAPVSSLPTDRLFNMWNIDKDRRRFYIAWINPILMMSEDRAVRQKAVEIAVSAVPNSDKMISLAAKATLAQAPTPEAQYAAEKLGLITG